jgi:CDP-glycerol glycerophosphotransferase
VRIVLLAAGVGSRLGNPDPKPLTSLSSGESIIGRATRLLAEAFHEDYLVAVVGYKKDLIMEQFPDLLYVYNRDYGNTNTSKSLLRALVLTKDEPVLWLNGDVVFDEAVLEIVTRSIAQDRSFVCVNTARVGEEEVKYDVDPDGFIRTISKQVTEPLGEAVGINYITSRDKPALIRRLRECEDQDYFERGIELSIDNDGVRVLPIDISKWNVIEIDFQEDLDAARRTF